MGVDVVSSLAENRLRCVALLDQVHVQLEGLLAARIIERGLRVVGVQDVRARHVQVGVEAIDGALLGGRRELDRVDTGDLVLDGLRIGHELVPRRRALLRIKTRPLEDVLAPDHHPDVAVEPDGLLAALDLGRLGIGRHDVALVGPVRVVRVEIGRDALVNELAEPDVVELEDVGLVGDSARLAEFDPIELVAGCRTGQLDGQARVCGLELRLGIRRPRLSFPSLDGVVPRPDDELGGGRGGRSGGLRRGGLRRGRAGAGRRRCVRTRTAGDHDDRHQRHQSLLHKSLLAMSRRAR